MLISLLIYNDGELDQSSVIPLVDGGTEGFKGNARVMLPGITACIECTLDLYPPQVNILLISFIYRVLDVLEKQFSKFIKLKNYI